MVDDDQRSFIALELIGRRDREAITEVGWHVTLYPKRCQPS